jgi:hypothetical protein
MFLIVSAFESTTPLRHSVVVAAERLTVVFAGLREVDLRFCSPALRAFELVHLASDPRQPICSIEIISPSEVSSITTFDAVFQSRQLCAAILRAAASAQVRR